MNPVQLRRVRCMTPADPELYDAWLASRSGIDYPEWLVLRLNPLMNSYLKAGLAHGHEWIGWQRPLEGINYGNI